MYKIKEMLQALIVEVGGSLSDIERQVINTFEKEYSAETSWENEGGPTYYVRDVFKDHEDLGDVVIIENRFKNVLYAVPYTTTEGGEISFSDIDQWQTVALSYEFLEINNDEPEGEPPEVEETETASESFAESITGVLAIQEAETPANRRDPLDIEMRLIKAGPGNSHDNHYYPGEMLRKYAEVFEGTKMCTVQHGSPSEKVEVAKIEKIVRFEEDGSPIARVGIFDPDFAEKTRNRAKKKMLDSLECSILADGTSQESEINGHTYKVVESIEKGGRVDFVYKAGAGGVAVALTESDKGAEPEAETPEPEPILENAKVLEVLRETNLPAPTQARLTKAEYKDEAELDEAITEAIAEVKAVSGSGQPLGTKSTEQAAPTRTAEQIKEDRRRAYSETRKRHGLTPNEYYN